MVVYGLVLAPLSRELRARFPAVQQPWYADDAAMEGRASQVAVGNDYLLEVGPPPGLLRLHREKRGYRPGGGPA
jgi:hypothetical protein